MTTISVPQKSGGWISFFLVLTFLNFFLGGPSVASSRVALSSGGGSSAFPWLSTGVCVKRLGVWLDREVGVEEPCVLGGAPLAEEECICCRGREARDPRTKVEAKPTRSQGTSPCETLSERLSPFCLITRPPAVRGQHSELRGLLISGRRILQKLRFLEEYRPSCVDPCGSGGSEGRG